MIKITSPFIPHYPRHKLSNKITNLAGIVRLAAKLNGNLKNEHKNKKISKFACA
jgi:hypothetical protein